MSASENYFSPSCSDPEPDDSSSGEYFEQAAADGPVSAGAALFAAFRGSDAAAGRKRQRPRQQPRGQGGLVPWLLAAVSALSQGEGSGQDLGTEGPPPKTRRRAVLVAKQRDIAARFKMEREAATASRTRVWAMSWAKREFPEMCGTAAETERFLKNARRWAKNLEKGLYGRAGGATISEIPVEVGAAGVEPAASSQAAIERHRSGQGTATVATTPSKRMRLAGAGGPGVMKAPCIGEELFAWFVDTLSNVKGRLPACLLLHRAQLVSKDLVGIRQQQIEAGALPPTPCWTSPRSTTDG